MAEIIARFADGRLLVQEEKLVETGAYASGKGVAVRIGNVRVVERILSLEAFMSGYGEAGRLLAPLKEATVSGDTIMVVLRRTDIGDPLMTGTCYGTIQASGYTSGTITLTGPIGSGTAALGAVSNVTSGLGQYGEILSGAISGRLSIIANVIGF